MVGRLCGAETAFVALAQQYPSDPEIFTALGQARLQQGSSRTAIDAFDRALAADPSLDAAQMGRVAAFGAPPSFEIGAWFGSTSNADSGLRQVEFAYWKTNRTRISARYDDSLSLDNPALARSGQSGETWLTSFAWVPFTCIMLGIALGGMSLFGLQPVMFGFHFQAAAIASLLEIELHAKTQ